MNNTKREKKLSHKVLISGLAVIFSLAMILTMVSAPTVQVSSTASPQVATSTGSYIPDPEMNTNITWSSFYNGWSPLEYNNGTANHTLPTQMSTIYNNPITVNMSKMQSPQLQTSLLNISKWINQLSTSGGVIASMKQIGKNISISTNATSQDGAQTYAALPLTWNQLPSQNFEFDYITITGYESGSTAVGWNIEIQNQTATASSTMSVTTILINNTLHQATSGVGDWSPAGTLGTHSFYASFPLSLAKNLSTTKSSGFKIAIQTGTPQETTTQNAITITGLAITEYQAQIGQNSTGKDIYAYTGFDRLSSFNPSMQGNITNNGYTVAVSQSLQNTTESQSSINSNNYIEQATYQGTFMLPAAPDLSYSNSNITLPMALPGSQYEVSNLNGVSYLSEIQSKTNGTFAFGTVNPNSQNTIILEVEFTPAQWNASSTAPSFWSIQGLEYYWWIGVIGLLSFIGLGSLASSHWGGTEENLKIPKGKFGR